MQSHEGVGAHDNEHPWAYLTAEQVLDREVQDPIAKRFFKTMARSDIATENHNTNGLNALKKRSLVFLISDFICAPGWEKPLGLLNQRHEVLAVRIWDPREMELPDAGPVTFTPGKRGRPSANAPDAGARVHRRAPARPESPESASPRASPTLEGEWGEIAQHASLGLPRDYSGVTFAILGWTPMRYAQA